MCSDWCQDGVKCKMTIKTWPKLLEALLALTSIIIKTTTETCRNHASPGPWPA